MFFVRTPQPKLLRGFDEEVRDFVTEQYQLHGLHLHPTASPTRIEKGPDGKLTLTAESKSEGKVCAALPASRGHMVDFLRLNGKP